MPRKRIRNSFLCIVGTGALLLTTSLPLSAADSDTISDVKIANAVDSELWAAKGVSANNIDVASDDGIVTLSGNVDNILAQESAIRIAKMTKGVRSVIDQLQVAPTGREDLEIQRDVLNALARDPATDSWEIAVEVNDGTVSLTGTAQSYAERGLAEKVAKSIRGVRQVDNQINLRYKVDRADNEIQNDIEQRLHWDARLDDELVTVSVENGEVTLTGSVGSAYEKTLVSTDAWVAGVKGVEDEGLTVAWWLRDQMQRKDSWASLDDEAIQDAIKDSFLQDPRVYSFNPSVSVAEGVATLTGTVDNLKAKRAAAQDAKNTVGVNRVNNYLKVRPTMTRSDEAIVEDVHSAFERDVFVDRFDLTVNASAGEVYLYGDVDSYYEKQHAEDLAAKVNGVTEVHNQLIVSYGYPEYDLGHYDWDPTLYDYDFDYATTRTKSDDVIRQDIQSQLWWSPWVDSDEVTVTVDEGVATLTGTVDSWSERNKAGENAIEGGAVKVKNKLDVAY